MKYFIICLLLLFWSPIELVGQNNKGHTIDSTVIKNQLIAYPIIFYLPETRWGFGVAGLYNFRFKHESITSNPSQIQFVTSITQNKQFILTFPFELYYKENLWKLKGEFSYYNNLHKFYGVGLDSKFEDKEFFLAQYPRLRTDLLHRFGNVFAGLRMRYDRLNITEKDTLLTDGNYLGKDGGTVSGVGLMAQWDTRDFIYNPTKGFFLETEAYFSGNFTGSDFTYQRYTLDFTKYTRLSENHTLATQIHCASIQGSTTFYDLVFFGSPRLMRGYQDRRFIDNNLLCLQAEYRFPLYNRLHGVAFVSSGTVSSKFKELFNNEYKWSYGAGLRFVLNKKDRVRLRLDYGRTENEGGALYITINDAF